MSSADEIKDRILSIALTLAAARNYRDITRDEIAAKAEVATGLISYYFGDMRKLKTQLIKRAIETENLRVLAQALANGHPVALTAPESLRILAAHQLAGV